MPERSTERRAAPIPGTTAAAAAAPESESPIRISRGELRVPPALARAYEQFLANDLAGARQSYEQVLKNDRKNIDALLGLAAIALREGNAAAAETLYLKVLEADPKEASAQAGLINLRGQADPTAAESRLKGLLAAQPESPTLNFALGNLYAGQRRWPEAQLAYFNAHTADPDNPDYLFNLAASLDQMHLPKIALDYYKGALAASNGRRPAFDPEQVRARIAELQR
jgi:Tfp pilus assembly protein PilF